MPVFSNDPEPAGVDFREICIALNFFIKYGQDDPCRDRHRLLKHLGAPDDEHCSSASTMIECFSKGCGSDHPRRHEGGVAAEDDVLSPR